MKRKKLIYGNCKVLTPDGELMFRCLEKKAKWYLDRNLATVIDNDPLTVQLTFEPQGKGERSEYLKLIRENKCVVCGDDNLEILTKHHLIPYEYRRHFHDDLKSHNSRYVVPICIACHEEYEHDYAINRKRDLAKEYSVPENGKTKERHKAEKIANALLKHRKNMPDIRVEELISELFEAMKETGIEVVREELYSTSTLTNYIEFFESNDEIVEHKHGQMVVEKCTNIEKFSNDWVLHFVKSMKPKHMPEFLIELCNACELYC